MSRAAATARRQQAFEQLAHAQDALAQLAQAEHQAHGDAVVLEVRIDGVDGPAAGVQALAQALHAFLQPVLRAQRVQHLHAQALHVADQRVEGLFLARGVAHAQAQLGREAGGQDLARAIGDGVQQGALPQRGAAGLLRRRQHGQQAVQQGLVQRSQPACVEFIGEGQHEQLGGIERVGAGGQQLVAQPLHQLAGHRGALGEAEVGQQRGDVHRAGEHGPPGLQAGPCLGGALRRLHQQRHAAGCALDALAVAAHPVQQGDELQVPLRQGRRGIDGGEQLRQVRAAALQCSTLPPCGCWGVCGPMASSTNMSIGQVNCSPSSATQK
jgi:hypothetical protein